MTSARKDPQTGEDIRTATQDAAGLVPCVACHRNNCPLLTTTQVARVLQLSLPSVYSMTSRQQLPKPVFLWRSGQRRGSPRWPACRIAAWLAATEVPE